MQNKPQNWYKKVSGNLYQLTELKRYYPKSNIGFWRAISDHDFGFMTIRLDDHGKRMPFIELTMGAQFNGATGYFDLDVLMRAALFHDNLVQELTPDDKKSPLLQTTRARKAANRVFRDIAKEDGSNFRAIMLYKAVKVYTRLFVN